MQRRCTRSFFISFFRARVVVVVVACYDLSHKNEKNDINAKTKKYAYPVVQLRYRPSDFCNARVLRTAKNAPSCRINIQRDQKPVFISGHTFHHPWTRVLCYTVLFRKTNPSSDSDTKPKNNNNNTPILSSLTYAYID